MLFQNNVLQEWGQSIKETFQNMDYNGFWGWILLILGILTFFLLILFTQYKRPERDSVKFTAITLILAGIFVGFGLDMILIARGIW
ncbi:MAG: hypothetical protein K9W44_03745 [Candidatus Lokiarchaeota archaeon]|nr:hypothetical protein [Candidatus Harpocratesius repetitus]